MNSKNKKTKSTKTTQKTTQKTTSKSTLKPAPKPRPAPKSIDKELIPELIQQALGVASAKPKVSSKVPKPVLSAHIREHNNSKSFNLLVYKNQSEMAAGVNSWCIQNRGGPAKEDLTELYGLFAPRYIAEPYEYEGDLFYEFGALFLSQDVISYGIIAHECLHAALFNDRTLYGFKGVYGEERAPGFDDEERLAYKLQSYVSKVIGNLEKLKCKIHGYDVHGKD